MTGDEHGSPSPGYHWPALASGARALVCLAGLVMFSSFVGFGALLRSLDVGLPHGLATNVLIFALPGQVVLFDMSLDGANLILTALAVSLTAVRLLPMVVVVLAKAIVPGLPAWPCYVVAQFTAITTWVIAGEKIETLKAEARLPWLLGLSIAQVSLICSATLVGYFAAGHLPLPLASALVFLTPCYFLIALLQGAVWRFDYLAIVFGAVLGAIVMQFAPDFALLSAGVIGGTLAYACARPDVAGDK